MRFVAFSKKFMSLVFFFLKVFDPHRLNFSLVNFQFLNFKKKKTQNIFFNCSKKTEKFNFASPKNFKKANKHKKQTFKFSFNWKTFILNQYEMKFNKTNNNI